MQFSTHAPKIAEQLFAREEKVSVAESSTGGLIAANLLSVPGASAYFEGGSVVYTLASRRAYLELDRDRVRDLKPLSEEMVMEFARSAREMLGTSWGIAELGAAGPAGSRYGHDAGISVIGIAGPVEASTTIITGSDDRAQNMIDFTEGALALFATTLSEG